MTITTYPTIDTILCSYVSGTLPSCYSLSTFFLDGNGGAHMTIHCSVTESHNAMKLVTLKVFALRSFLHMFHLGARRPRNTAGRTSLARNRISFDGKNSAHHASIIYHSVLACSKRKVITARPREIVQEMHLPLSFWCLNSFGNVLLSLDCSVFLLSRTTVP